MTPFNKTRFRQAYQMAMNEQAPKMYKELRSSGTLEAHLKDISDEAQKLYESTLKHLQDNQGMGSEATFVATEIVFGELIKFAETKPSLMSLL
jgi:hypothetical protein